MTEFNNKGSLVLDGMKIKAKPREVKRLSNGEGAERLLEWEGTEFYHELNKEDAIALILHLAKAFDVQRSDLISVHTPPGDKDD